MERWEEGWECEENKDCMVTKQIHVCQEYGGQWKEE